ncbi:hypothetical protein [Olivibacter sp. XZL3]|uniref:hypothetical protein n=1 Tax=Olivibacter sp. XZL3 TaxID=1735116 RepID=UPI00106630B4|nr:hypothetical protein [Olivibacter sp. XZL3]
MPKILSTEDFISQPLEKHSFSETFLQKCRQQQVLTLKDLLALGTQGLLRTSSFDEADREELYAYLQQHRILYLLTLNR